LERIPFVGKELAERLIGPVRLAVESVNVLALAAKEWAEGQRASTEVTVYEGLHPNYWAQLALRNCVRQAYANGAPKGGTCTIEGPGLTQPGVGGIPAGGLREPKMMLK
jgi:transcriptional regulator GlxA family with amidase domain